MLMCKGREIKSYIDIRKLVDDGILFVHHASLFRGYVSRRLSDKDLPFYAYNGRFGSGFVVESPNFQSSTYSYKTYYIIREEREAS